MAKEQKVYMPLVIGDWLKGTWGMKAEVRGVYLNLLLFQWDNGYIPADMETLAQIDPEVGSVWVSLKHKFVELSPGKLHNIKNDEVKAFWSKQRKNGETGGRPKKVNPNDNPNSNPKANPKGNLHIDLDLDNDLESKKESFIENFSLAFNERTLEAYAMQYKHLDVSDELQQFRLKCDNDPLTYHSRDPGGLRNAFQYQLKTTQKPQTNGTNLSRKQQQLNRLVEDHEREFGSS